MSTTENVELTVICLIYKDNKILLQDRIKKDWKGYTLPGGHVEKDESFINAVIREMKEETGLTIKHPILCGIKHFPIDNGRYLVLLYKTNEFEGHLTSSEEGKMGS
jgi:8-oxo-dGTP diphosphatase